MNTNPIGTPIGTNTSSPKETPFAPIVDNTSHEATSAKERPVSTVVATVGSGAWWTARASNLLAIAPAAAAPM